MLGGSGWLRLAQQNATCELNSMPQIGDDRTVEGALESMLEGAVEGCGIGAALLSGLTGPVAGCLIGIAPGMSLGVVLWLLDTANEYRVDFSRWCRENYTNCRGNEYYARACQDLIEIQ
ncbi:hypothetical protein SAMN04488087_0711 [Rhodothermus profundi]|uniref:Uncharacterized protein n=1 Tax=Rhodothermus profundi TaxID=633813 RepID=A0A1M6R577_9BACT|nr:hypothetical protein SAMN04488087_0711 [Rhodothermus profundi]